MQDKSIDNALRFLRAQIIRDGGEGLEHVEALLQLRGDNLAPVPRKITIRFKRSKLRLAILRALGDGPGRVEAITKRICAAHDVEYCRTFYVSVAMQLTAMKRAGHVVHEGRLWRSGPL